ncbi:unnamed protein product [Euphydryas editha]|uniref:Uncharacterized protein n=1 Tax=Euphydryas editha TaxID=104508 RepID=A0AAU9UZX4_EUPED|nr:unnamed protein product [Euphydryas editha]
MGNVEEQLDRRQEINTTMKRAILQDLQQLLHKRHAFIYSFRLFKTALERMLNDDYKVVTRVDKRPAGTHECTFNSPTIDEVAILIVFENLETCDIVLIRRDTGQLQHLMNT